MRETKSSYRLRKINLTVVKASFVFTILVILFSLSAKAQLFSSVKDKDLKTGDNPLIRIPLTERVVDDKIAKSLAIAPVYRYESDSIEPYTMFGVEEKPDQTPLIIRKMPDMTGMVDTGYTFLYFSGANTEYNDGYLLTMIGNYRKSRRTIYFFVDRNNNLDFSDDGPPIELAYHDFSITITLKNLDIPESEYKIKLTRIEEESYQYRMLLTEHYKKHSGTKKFTDIRYCYREQRLNTIAGYYRSDSDSFLVAIKDYNVNGVFNESCTDRFYVGSLGDEVYTDEMIDFLPDITLSTFERAGKLYRIRAVHSSGEYVEIQQVENAKLEKKLKKGRKVPNIEFVDVNNEDRELKEFKKKEVYLYFFDLEVMSDEDTLYLGKLHREHGDKITVVALNHGDPARRVYVHHYYNGIQYEMGFSTYLIGKKFFVENLPKGVYLGKRRKLKNEHLDPKSLYLSLSK